MSFNGDEGTMVTLDEATVWAAAYRANIKKFDGTKAHFFGKNKINSILNQTGCMGIRIYKGFDGTTPVMILVGTDASENDLYNGLLLERGTACPPYCGGGGNPLQG